MKIYTIDAIQPPNLMLIPWHEFVKAERAYKLAIKDHLDALGYLGPLTGKIVSFPVADSRAEYMYAQAPGSPRKDCLVHLPLGDAWEYRDVQYIPRAEIIRRLRDIGSE